jgi:hypothetical protein
VGCEGFEEARPDSNHPIQSIQAAERTVRLPIGNDDLGQAWPQLGQPCQLPRSGAVDVDLLALAKRATEPPGAVSLRDW